MLMSARWILFPFFFAAWAWGNSFVVSLSPPRERRKQTQTHSAPTLPLFEPSRKGTLCPKYFSNRRHTTVSRKTCGATTPFFPHLCTINSAQAPPRLAHHCGGREGETDGHDSGIPFSSTFVSSSFPSLHSNQFITPPVPPPSIPPSPPPRREFLRCRHFLLLLLPYVRRSLSLSTSPTNQPTPQLKKNWNFAEYTSAGFFCPRHKPEPFLQKKTFWAFAQRSKRRERTQKSMPHSRVFCPSSFIAPATASP